MIVKPGATGALSTNVDKRVNPTRLNIHKEDCPIERFKAMTLLRSLRFKLREILWNDFEAGALSTNIDKRVDIHKEEGCPIKRFKTMTFRRLRLTNGD